MASGDPIMVGAGIQKGAPFTVGSISRIATATPPTLADSEIFQRTAGAVQVITIGVDGVPLATEKLKVLGGLISDTVVAGIGGGNFIGGQGVVLAPTVNGRNVVIGWGARCDNSGGGGADVNTSYNVVIGSNTLANTGLTQGMGGCVVIGSNITMGVTTGSAAQVLIGTGIAVNDFVTGPIVGANALGRGQGVAFGNFAGATAAVNYWVAVGNSANVGAAGGIAIGDNAEVNSAYSIALGRNALVLQANQLVIGALNLGINSVLIGEGDTKAAYAGIEYRHTNGSGANDPAGMATVKAPLGTGNSIGGGWRVAAGVKGASGAAVQMTTTVLRVEGGTGNLGVFDDGNFGGGEGVMYIKNAAVLPTTTPLYGGLLYVNLGGALTYRGPGGTTTVIAPS